MTTQIRAYLELSHEDQEQTRALAGYLAGFFQEDDEDDGCDEIDEPVEVGLYLWLAENAGATSEMMTAWENPECVGVESYSDEDNAVSVELLDGSGPPEGLFQLLVSHGWIISGSYQCEDTVTTGDDVCWDLDTDDGKLIVKKTVAVEESALRGRELATCYVLDAKHLIAAAEARGETLKGVLHARLRGGLFLAWAEDVQRLLPQVNLDDFISYGGDDVLVAADKMNEERLLTWHNKPVRLEVRKDQDDDHFSWETGCRYLAADMRRFVYQRSNTSVHELHFDEPTDEIEELEDYFRQAEERYLYYAVVWVDEETCRGIRPPEGKGYTKAVTVEGLPITWMRDWLPTRRTRECLVIGIANEAAVADRGGATVEDRAKEALCCALENLHFGISGEVYYVKIVGALGDIDQVGGLYGRESAQDFVDDICGKDLLRVV